MLDPNLFALSDMSTIAISAILAASAVLFPSPCKSDAEKLVTVSMYLFADTPAVLYALFALSITVCALSLNSVSTPPMFCSKLATESRDILDTAPNAAATPATDPAITFNPPLATLPSLEIPELNPDSLISVLNFNEPS